MGFSNIWLLHSDIRHGKGSAVNLAVGGRAQPRLACRGGLCKSVYFIWLVFLSIIAFSRCTQASQDMFFQRSCVALLEVEQIKSSDEKDRAEETLKRIRPVVRVKAILPPGDLLDKQQEILVTHEQSFIKRGRGQDWFPTKIGERIVVAFSGKEIPPAKDLVPLLSSYSSQAVWHDCEAFYTAANCPKADQAAALTKALQDDPQHRGPTFFHLIDHYNRWMVDDLAFSSAAADYLRNTAVPLEARIEIIRDLREAGTRDPAANRALVAATLLLALEAKRANLHPGEIGNILILLCAEFVADRPGTALPNVESPTRQELLPLMDDKRVVSDQKRIIPLMRWLKGGEPGHIPQTSEAVRRKEISQQPATIPQKDELQPRTEPIAQAGFLFWSKVAVIAAGVLGLLFTAIILLRKRKTSR